MPFGCLFPHSTIHHSNTCVSLRLETKLGTLTLVEMEHYDRYILYNGIQGSDCGSDRHPTISDCVGTGNHVKVTCCMHMSILVNIQWTTWCGWWMMAIIN